MLGSVGDTAGTETVPGPPLLGVTVQRGTQTCWDDLKGTELGESMSPVGSHNLVGETRKDFFEEGRLS